MPNVPLSTIHYPLRTMRTLSSILLTSLLLVLLPTQVFAATFNDVLDGPWNGCDTWGTCPGAVEGTDYPGITDTATIDTNIVTMSGAAKVKDLYIDGGTVTLVHEGLVGYWKLDEGADNTCSGGEDACDTSGNGNHGTIANGDSDEWSANPVNGTNFTNPYAMDLDGGGDHVTISDSPSLNYAAMNGLTISLWARPDVSTSTPGDEMDLFTQYDGSGNRAVYFHVDHPSDKWQFCLDNCDGAAVIDTTTISVGTWVHLVGTWIAGTEAKLYKNGLLVATDSSVDTVLDDSSGDHIIGARALSGGSEFFNGLIDDVRIYDRALSLDEIGQLYNGFEHADLPKFTASGTLTIDDGLLGYWKIDEGADNLCSGGEDVCDTSGNGNHGTIANGESDEWSTTTPSALNFSNPYSMDFEGNEFVETTLDVELDGISEVTISAWMKRRSTAGGKYVLLGRENGAYTDALNIQMWDDGLIYFMPDNPGFATAASNDTNWHHVVMVFNGNLSGDSNRLKGYIDGVEQSLSYAATIPATTEVMTDPFVIGETVPDGGSFTDGFIDDVRVYNRALSIDEVRQLYAGSEHVDFPFFTVDGTWENTGGAFNTNGGTVVMTSSTDETILTDGDAFHHFQIEDPTESGLVGYWKFDESSGTNAADSSGSSNAGTLTNMAGTEWTAGSGATKFYNTYGLEFNAAEDSNDEIDIGTMDVTGGDGGITMALWVNADDCGSDGARYISKATDGDDSADSHLWMFGTVDSGGACAPRVRIKTVASSTTDTFIDTDDQVPTGRWAHIAATFDTTTVKIYIDGVQTHSESHSNSGNLETDSGREARIGNHPGVDYYFDGLMDDVRIYNRALTAREIEHLANGWYASGDTSTATFTVTDSLDVDGSLSLQSGVLSPGTRSINIQENWNNFSGESSFVAGSSTITLDGLDQGFYGTGSTFSTVIKTVKANNSTDLVLTFKAAATHIFSKTMAFLGIDDNDRINLISSSPGTAWFVDADNTNLQFMDVTDSTNIDVDAINAINQNDGGSNTNWCFSKCTKGRSIYFFGF